MRHAALAVAGLALTGCGGARVAQAARPLTGVVRYCATDSRERAAVHAFDRAHARHGLTVRLRLLPLAPAKRLDTAVKRGECDVVELLDVDVAQNAASGRLRDLTAYLRPRRRDFVPVGLRSVRYARRDWAVPLYLNVALLFSHDYSLPRTLQALYRGGGLVFADGPDSALGFYETAYAAGGRMLTPDGRHSALDSPQNRAALALICTALQRGRVTGADAPGAYRRFRRGRARFMRNWNQFAAGDYRHSVLLVDALPPFAGGHRAALVTSADLAVTRTARNPRAALAFIDARVSVAGARPGAALGYLPPLAKSYDDAEGRHVLALPYVRRALEHGATLPVTPHFKEVAAAVNLALHLALDRHESATRALREASRALDAALANDAPGGEA